MPAQPDPLDIAIHEAENHDMSHQIEIVRGPSLKELRAEFEALAASDQAEETAKHLASLRDPAKPRSHFSNLLSANGVGADLVR